MNEEIKSCPFCGGKATIRGKMSGIGKYWAREVSVDYGTKDVKRVDFVQFEPAGK